MANTQDIRRRIKSIRNTAQITKAMQMVAASKMRKAQQHALGGTALLGADEPRARFAQEPHLIRCFIPLLQIRPTTKELVLIISTDKGSRARSTPTSCGKLPTYDKEKTGLCDRRPQRRANLLRGRGASCWRILS
jgi:F-type H+-transporting ATPase subunit gamma